jgi:hypothetical protein
MSYDHTRLEAFCAMKTCGILGRLSILCFWLLLLGKLFSVQTRRVFVMLAKIVACLVAWLLYRLVRYASSLAHHRKEAFRSGLPVYQSW